MNCAIYARVSTRDQKVIALEPWRDAHEAFATAAALAAQAIEAAQELDRMPGQIDGPVGHVLLFCQVRDHNLAATRALASWGK